MSEHNDTPTDEARQKVVSIIDDTKIAMLTHIDSAGRLVSHPMATQEAEFDGTILFIAERDSDKVADLRKNDAVNVAYSGKGSWVSVSGTARIENDVEKMKELWSAGTDAWLEGGPENPNNVLIVIDGDSAQYWDTPGSSTVMKVAALAKSVAGGERPEGDQGVVDL